MTSKESPPRLSETREVQSAFRREMVLLFTEVGTPPPDVATGVIDGKGLGDGFRRFPTRHWEDLRLKPEHVRVLLSLTFLLEQCSRLQATTQHLDTVLALFHPAKPTTPVVADAYGEVIDGFVKSIDNGVVTPQQANEQRINELRAERDAVTVERDFLTALRRYRESCSIDGDHAAAEPTPPVVHIKEERNKLEEEVAKPTMNEPDLSGVEWWMGCRVGTSSVLASNIQ
jgi:hypothetical protein